MMIMRRINSSKQGRGWRHSGAMLTDDDTALTNLDKQNSMLFLEGS